MADLIDAFAAEHFIVNQISQRRREWTLVTLREFHADVPDPREVTVEHVVAWLAAQVQRGSHVNTVRWRLMMVRPFWKWMWQRGHIDADKWLRLQAIPPPRGAASHGEPRPYTRAEIKQLWADLARKHRLATPRQVLLWERRTQHKIRRQWGGNIAEHGRRLQLEAIVSLALFCGLRRNEIWALTLDDIHPDNAYLVVRGKRTDHRERLRQVPYTDGARAAMFKWLEFRRSLHIRGHRALWISLWGAQTYRDPMPYNRFEGLLRRIGPGYEFHRLRHTCATERLRAGMDVEVLMKFLGHANIQQTLAYTAIVAKDIERLTLRDDEKFMRAVGRRAA